MFKTYKDSDYYENDTITTPQIDSCSELMIGFLLVNITLVVAALWV